MVLRGIQKRSVRVQSLVANSMCVHVSVWICVEVYIYVCVHICVYMWGCISVCAYMCVYVWGCISMCVPICVYMCVCTQVEHRPPLGVSSSCTLLYLSLWGESLAVPSMLPTQLYSGPWGSKLRPSCHLPGPYTPCNFLHLTPQCM